jgi:hypothetical protein
MGIWTNDGKKTQLYRLFTVNASLSATQYLAPTKFKVGIDEIEESITATDLVDPVDITVGVTTKTFVSGYPSINNTNLEVTTRAHLTSLEANGNDLNALGIFNQDSTPLMLSMDKFENESKSDTDEFMFVVKDRVI